MNQIKELEKLAIDFHRRGLGWTEYWAMHADAIRKAEPFNNRR
ncbi:MAG: hypothetical protein ABSA16_17405 [Thermoguttaceae bacterium]